MQDAMVCTKLTQSTFQLQPIAGMGKVKIQMVLILFASVPQKTWMNIGEKGGTNIIVAFCKHLSLRPATFSLIILQGGLVNVIPLMPAAFAGNRNFH